MDAAKTLLVVDDDAELREHVSDYLRENGFSVFTAESAPAMDAVLASHHIDLLILDVGLPGEDGLSICRRLGETGGPPIIMASAAGEEVDRVIGLELGADDYLPKPFSPRELLARVRAQLRRQEHIADGGIRRGQFYQFEGFVYDPAKRVLHSPAKTVIFLTSGEAGLLNSLLSKPKQVIARDDLNAFDSGGPGRGADIVISRLRKKLEGHKAGGLLRTLRGQGYMIDCVVTRE